MDISLLWVNGLESTTINSEKYTLNFSTDLGLSQLMINQQKIKEAGKPKSDPRQKYDYEKIGPRDVRCRHNFNHVNFI